MVKHSKTFYLHSGKKFDSLKGLAKELRHIATDAFKHHVNETKNDFANWIRHSMKNKDLAIKVEKRLDKIEIELEILRHLVFDEKPKKKTVIAEKVVKPKKEKVVKKGISKKKVPKKVVKEVPKEEAKK